MASKLLKFIPLTVLFALTIPCVAQNRMTLSPDGKYVAYAERDALWLLSTEPKSVPTKISDIPMYFALPRWAPTSTALAYYSRASGTLQLWIYDLKGRRSRQVSFVDGGINPLITAMLTDYQNGPLRYSWSPDGRTIVFSSQVAAPTNSSGAAQNPHPPFPSPERLANGEPVVLTANTPAEWTLHGVVSYGPATNYTYNDISLGIQAAPQLRPHKVTQLFLLETSSGKITQLTHDTAGYFTPEWSPDGRHIAYMSAEGQIPLRAATLETNIFTLEIATGIKTKITDGVMQKTMPRWSPDGEWIAYKGKDIREAFVRKEARLYVVPVKRNGPPRSVSDNIDRALMAFDWGPDGTSLLISYWDGLAHPLVRADATTGRVSAVSPPSAVVEDFGVSQQGISWTQVTDPNGPTTIWFSGDKQYQLYEIEPPADLRRERRWEIVTWTNSRKEELDGLLIYPINYSPSHKYPLVVDAYSMATIRRSGYEKVNFFRASSNYFLFRPNHRAPQMWLNPLRSAIYSAAAVGPNGPSVLTDDILSGVDLLIERKLVDSDRMCVAGMSNGGLNGEYLLTQTSRFKCAVLQSPSVSNWLSYVFLTPDSADAIHYMYGVAPWEDASIYTALTPLFQADRITTPLLLAVGDREPHIIPTIEMFNVLRFLKKDVTLLRYTTQGHGFTGAAEEDFTKRVADFFDRYLGGADSTSKDFHNPEVQPSVADVSPPSRLGR